MRVLRIDHVQLAMPPHSEDRARKFYSGVLRLTEVPKPPELAQRGGAWFENGTVKVHLGVEEDFHPAKKAHPALVVEGLNELIEAFERAGHKPKPDADFDGCKRVHVEDPFGNRIELMERA